MIPASGFASMNGALLINKHQGVSSFGIIELLQKQLQQQNGIKRRELPKLGHGGTLDPFATGLLVVCVGKAVKLARYFLGGTKTYSGIIHFGQTTIPGDPTSPVSETMGNIPESMEAIQKVATQFCQQPYLQTPPMHSAKKKNGKPLYELARAGIEVDREPKLCHLYSFEILGYEKPCATFRLTCSSGTYVRTLAQDLGKLLGTVAMLDTLRRDSTGAFQIEKALTTDQVFAAGEANKNWDELSCWIPFDRMLDGYEHAHATADEAQALYQGRQNVLFNILRRSQTGQEIAKAPVQGQESCLAIYHADKLVAIARKEEAQWALERVFTPSQEIFSGPSKAPL